MIKTVLLVGILGFIFQYGRHVVVHLELTKEIHPTNNTCFALRGPIGAEDLVRWRDFVLVSNLDSIPLWTWPKEDPGISEPKAAQPGAIWALSGIGDETKEPQLERIEMVGFPSGVAFHPHGIGLLPEKELLFVVNHAYTEGGERVDVFKLSTSNGRVQLTYQSTVNFDECCMGILNDVTPVSETEFYVTKYLPTPDPPQGRKLDPLSKIRNIIYATNAIQYKATTIYYCNSTSGPFNRSCKVVGPKGLMWNGLTSSPDGNIVYVNDLSKDKTIYAFKRTETSDLVSIASYKIPHYWDNIQIDLEDGKIWGAGIALLKTHLSYSGDWEHHVGAPRKGGAAPGGALCPSNIGSLVLSTGEVQTHLIHDGSLLGAGSAGIRFGKHIVLGSFVDNGVLVCTLA